MAARAQGIQLRLHATLSAPGLIRPHGDWLNGHDFRYCAECSKNVQRMQLLHRHKPPIRLAKSLLPGVFLLWGVPGRIFLGFFCIYQLAKAQISPTFRSPKGAFQQSI
jgi:hypothetical protein